MATKFWAKHGKRKSPPWAKFYASAEKWVAKQCPDYPTTTFGITDPIHSTLASEGVSVAQFPNPENIKPSPFSLPALNPQLVLRSGTTPWVSIPSSISLIGN